MNKKILIVEDEDNISMGIQSVLENLDYDVIGIATNYDDAIYLTQEAIPDLILMDVNLKNSKDGIEAACKILETRYIPIVYLTGFSDEDTLTRAIKTNPVGYITKPFKRADLRVAIQLALCKVELTHKEIEVDKQYTKLGYGYYFDLKTEVLYFKDIVVKLGIKESSLLKQLILANGNVVTFKQMEYELWSEHSVSDSTLRTVIYRLRAKLDNKIIESIYSCGCRILLPEI
jgi:DNA-binding response OmpR family regulator